MITGTVQLTAKHRARLRGKTVAVSTSEADDPATRDRSPLDQRDLVVELARDQILAGDFELFFVGIPR